MFQRFYTNTLQSNFIKYLLSEVEIPTIPFTTNITHVVPNAYYIHNNYIVRINERPEGTITAYDVDSLTSADYTKYEPYIFGKAYRGYTTKYTSSSNSYDPQTHYYLGMYLRAIKGYYGIDLMPFYNCYTNELVSTVGFKYSPDVVAVVFNPKAKKKHLTNTIIVPPGTEVSEPVVMNYQHQPVTGVKWVDESGSQRTFPRKINSTIRISMELPQGLTESDVYISWPPESKFDTLVYGLTDNHSLGVNFITKNDAYTYYAIPIKFCSTYTLAIDCPTTLEVLPCFIDSNGLLRDLTVQLQHVLSPHRNYTSLANYRYSSVSYSKPVTYISPCLHTNYSDLYAYEKYLKLLVKVPSTCTSSIVLLEGEYTNLQPYQDKYFSTSWVDIKDEHTRWNDKEDYKKAEKDARGESYTPEYKVEPTSFTKYLNKYMISDLSLLSMNRSVNYAFSSRLVEYLSNNVITSSEKLSKNIELIQRGLNRGPGNIDGLWDDELRVQTFEKVRQFINTYRRENILDSNGFADKDIEKILLSKKFMDS